MNQQRIQRIKRLREKHKTVIYIPKDGKDGAIGEIGIPGLPGLVGLQGDSGERGLQGLPGVRGKQGFPGAKGEKGSKGDVGVVWRGEWVISTLYYVGDAVNLFGSAFICTTEHTSRATSKPRVGDTWKKYWAILAERGESGPGGVPGIQGIQGEQGPPGPAGSDVEIISEAPIGSIDGLNKVYTVQFQYKSGSTRLFIGGLRQYTPNDYSETTTTTFTVVDAPLPGDILVIDYTKL